jgi:hypothetical protein
LERRDLLLGTALAFALMRRWVQQSILDTRASAACRGWSVSIVSSRLPGSGNRETRGITGFLSSSLSSYLNLQQTNTYIRQFFKTRSQQLLIQIVTGLLPLRRLIGEAVTVTLNWRLIRRFAVTESW